MGDFSPRRNFADHAAERRVAQFNAAKSEAALWGFAAACGMFLCLILGVMSL